MNNLDSFTQFLNSAYRRILEACLEDEAVETLKILQNKEYLQLRINELFSEIYVAERQKKIEELIEKINSFQTNRAHQTEFLQIQCRTCESFQKQIKEKDRQIADLNKKLTQMTAYEYKETKRVQSLLLKQNEELKKQLKQLQAELTQALVVEYSQREATSIQFLRFKQQNRKQLELREREIQTLRGQLASKIDQNKILQKRLLENAQRRQNEQRQAREVTAQMKNTSLLREKQQNEISILKNQQNLLNQKISRLQIDNQYLKQKLKLQEKENSKLKDLNNQLLTFHKTQQSQSKNKAKGQDSSEFYDKMQHTQSINIQLQRQNKHLKQQFEKKVKELQESNIFLEKNNFATNQQSRKNQIRYDKEVRQLKQELKRLGEQARAQFQEDKQYQIQSIRKQSKTSELQLFKQVQKAKEQNRQLSRALLKAQQTLNELNSEQQQQKKRLLDLIEKQKHLNKEMKNHINIQRNSTELIQQQNRQKIKQFQIQLKNLRKELESKEKQIKDIRKQTARKFQQENNKVALMENFKARCQKLQDTIVESQKENKKVKEVLKNKEKTMKQIIKKLQAAVQEKDELEKKISNLTKNQQLLQLRMKRLSEELNQKKEIILSLQQNNQTQIMDIYQNTRHFAFQNRKQIESYYMSLLKEQQESKANLQLKQANLLNEQEITDLRTKKEEIQQKMMLFKAKYGEQLKQRSNYEEKIVRLLQQVENFRIENAKLSEMLRDQKRNTTSMIRGYQQKMIQYYNIFGQFKRQLHLNLKNQLFKIKQDLKQIATSAQTQIQKSKQWLAAYCYKLNQQVQSLSTNYKLKYQRLKHQYDFGIVFKLEEQKRQMKVQLDMQLKEKSMEFYTVIAQKEHIIRQKQQIEGKLGKKLSDMETKNEQIQKIARQNYKKQEEMKEILTKMNNKVNQAQKHANSLKSETQYYRRENMELKKEISSLQLVFKEKIQRSRESYALQNERLFAKYEKEFGRLIVSNKKGLQYSSLLNHSSSCNNMLIPTKGCHNDVKLEKIQKQIQEQKKKLNILEQGMEDKSKFQKTSKIGSKDHIKIKK